MNVNSKKQIALLKEVREIINELGGIDETLLHKIGITLYECENPTVDTVIRLRNYLEEKQEKEIERLDFNL